MKREQFCKSYFVLPLLFTFSMLVFGCGKKDEPRIQAERIEDKQLMKENSEHTNEVDVVRVDTSDSESSQVFPVEDEIQLDEWMQLVKDIKSTLGEMQGMGEKVLQTSDR